METYEKDILFQHKLVLDSMRKALANLAKIEIEVKKNKGTMDTKLLLNSSAIVHKELGAARASQEQAYKEATNLISYFQKLWK